MKLLEIEGLTKEYGFYIINILKYKLLSYYLVSS